MTESCGQVQGAPTPNVLPVTSVRLRMQAQKLRDRDYLSKSDPLCAVFQQTRGPPKRRRSQRATTVDYFESFNSLPEWREIGRTEWIRNNLNPEWANPITVDYFFEEKQLLMFEIYDVDSVNDSLEKHDFLGRLEIELAEIVSFGTITKPLTGLNGKLGSITISCEEVDEGGREIIEFNISGTKLDKKDFFGKSDPYLNFYRRSEDGSRQIIHRTEFIKKTLNPTWKKFEIEKKLLCQGDLERVIEIECWDNDDDSFSSHDYIGKVTLTAGELLGKMSHQLELVNEKKKAKNEKKYKNSGVLNINLKIIPQFTFLDYIAGGTQLDFAVAIDFTSSNGAVHKHTSLHFISQEQPNQYEVAIRSVLDICQYYNNSKKFDAYGFGAIVPPSAKMNPVFQLNNPKDYITNPTVVGVDGVLNSYRNVIRFVKLHGPTNFAPIVREISRGCLDRSTVAGSRYQVLLIITDGAISDRKSTIRSIIDASHLPLSIIIVGVGDADFDTMDELDGDGGRLNYDGHFAARDIVQFVPLRKFWRSDSFTAADALNNDRVMAMLAKEVLAEVPAQLTSYMKARQIQPRPKDDPFPRDTQAEDIPIVSLQSLREQNETKYPAQNSDYLTNNGYPGGGNVGYPSLSNGPQGSMQPPPPYNQIPPVPGYSQPAFNSAVQPAYNTDYQNAAPEWNGQNQPYPPQYSEHANNHVSYPAAPEYPPPAGFVDPNMIAMQFQNNYNVGGGRGVTRRSTDPLGPNPYQARPRSGSASQTRNDDSSYSNTPHYPEGYIDQILQKERLEREAKERKEREEAKRYQYRGQGSHCSDIPIVSLQDLHEQSAPRYPASNSGYAPNNGYPGGAPPNNGYSGGPPPNTGYPSGVPPHNGYSGPPNVGYPGGPLNTGYLGGGTGYPYPPNAPNGQMQAPPGYNTAMNQPAYNVPPTPPYNPAVPAAPGYSQPAFNPAAQPAYNMGYQQASAPENGSTPRGVSAPPEGSAPAWDGQEQQQPYPPQYPQIQNNQAPYPPAPGYPMQQQGGYPPQAGFVDPNMIAMQFQDNCNVNGGNGVTRRATEPLGPNPYQARQRSASQSGNDDSTYSNTPHYPEGFIDQILDKERKEKREKERKEREAAKRYHGQGYHGGGFAVNARAFR